jgi:hypothetical protein
MGAVDGMVGDLLAASRSDGAPAVAARMAGLAEESPDADLIHAASRRNQVPNGVGRVRRFACAS